MAEMLVRSFDVTALELRDDGRTVEGRIIPYGEVALVSDGGEPYREQFLAGSLTRVIQTATRRGNAAWIGLNLEHDDGVRARIGYAASVRQDDDGGYATFRLYASDDLVKVRSMLEESHVGLSVGFVDVAKPRMVDGVVSRVQVHLEHVAATPIPSYAGAGIVAVRSAHASEPLPTPELDAVNAYLRSLQRVPTTIPEPTAPPEVPEHEEEEPEADPEPEPEAAA